MLIETIILENYRPFLGRNEIDLTTTKDKPVVLVKAMNDIGKTSLFSACIWCLYGGSVAENLRNINWSAHQKGNGRTSVTLIFDHNDQQYDITRSVDFLKLDKNSIQTIKDKVAIRIDGKIEPFDETGRANDYIESILPKDASQFFFFDGEDIQKYTAVRSGDTVKEAIQVVLGIKELINAKDDLSTIKEDVRRELNGYLAEDKKIKDEVLQNKALLEEINAQRSKIPILDEKISGCQRMIESCDKSLEKHKEIQERVEARKQEEKREKELLAQVAHNQDNQVKIRGDLAFLLAAPLLVQLEKTGQTQIPHWKRDAIVYILNSGSNRCICDRPLDGMSCPKCGAQVASQVKNRFEDELEKGSDGGRLQFLGEMATRILREKSPQFIEKIVYDYAAERVNLESQVSVCRALISDLKKEIGEQGDFSGEIASFELNRQRARDDIESYNDQRRQFEVDVAIKERDYNRKQKELIGKSGHNQDVTKTEKIDGICKASLEGFNYAIEALVESSRLKVAQLSSKFFLELTNAPQLYEGLEITNEYEIKVRTKGGTVRHVWEQAPGAGQRQIIAISFISALNAFTARDAPIVIDTPISRLDPVHKSNLIKHYPHMGPQTVILYQPNEMTDEEIELIHGSISSEWEMKRDPSDPESTVITRMRGGLQ